MFNCDTLKVYSRIVVQLRISFSIEDIITYEDFFIQYNKQTVCN